MQGIIDEMVRYSRDTLFLSTSSLTPPNSRFLVKTAAFIMKNNMYGSGGYDTVSSNQWESISMNETGASPPRPLSSDVKGLSVPSPVRASSGFESMETQGRVLECIWDASMILGTHVPSLSHPPLIPLLSISPSHLERFYLNYSEDNRFPCAFL